MFKFILDFSKSRMHVIISELYQRTREIKGKRHLKININPKKKETKMKTKWV